MFKKILQLTVVLVTLTICVGLSLALAGEEKGKDQGVQKILTNDNYNFFTINNLFNWYGNNGNSSYNTSTANSGLEFPKGSGNAPVFEDGVLWGGFHKGRAEPKVGGSAYRYGLQAGEVTGYGGPAETDRPPFSDPTLAKYRVYKVRPDVTPTTVYADVREKMEAEAALVNRYQTLSGPTLFANYQRDWNEWPAKDGLPAPYKDVNGNGVYNPAVDIPGQSGADQTLYYVANDLASSRTTNMYFSPPIGLEVHRTVWGYNLPGALGNTIFASTMIINKSGAPLDSAFLVQWSDPDLGESGDDYCGCDIGRSLGFVYNGKNVDNVYGSAVPAVGYDFFQGPIVATGNSSDSAVFRLKYRKGFKNLGMTTFDFFINSSAIFTDPPQGVAGGDVQWYRLMNAAITTTGAAFIDPTTGAPTKYCLSGDPLAGKGWLDGTHGLTPGDRRICLVTGPFTLANKDTQEVVVATIVGLGGDRISSIAVLKFYSDLAQSAYNTLFNISRPPPAPTVDVAALDGQVAISWSDSVGATKIETFNSGGYQFEGYNVWQFPSPTETDPTVKPVRLATFDLVDAITTIFDDQYDEATGYVVSKPAQYGTDNGIKRSFSTKNDAIGKRTLINGSTYYFGVTSYSFNSLPTAKPAQLESTPNTKAVVPQWASPGVRYFAANGDTLKDIVHTGPSDGKLIAQVINPLALKKEGAIYKVVFNGTVPGQTWNVVRTWNGVTDTVAKGISDQAATDAGAVIVDGIDFRVVGAPQDFKDMYVAANASGVLSPPEAATINSDAYGYPHPSTSGTPVGTRQQTAGLTASSGFTIGTGMNSPTMDPSYVFFKSRVTQADARWPVIIPYDFEIRFTAAGGKALIPSAFTGVADYIVNVPFELWNIGINTPTNTADDYRLYPYILDVDNSASFNFLTKAGTDSVDNGGGGADHTQSGGTDDPFTDWIYWVAPTDKSPGQAGYTAVAAAEQAAVTGGLDPYLSATIPASGDVLRRMVLIGWNFGQVGTGTYKRTMPETGTIFRIISTKPNQPTDVFQLTVAPAAQNSALAEADADRVNVFPNPYIGFNAQEDNKYQRWVTFTHMPRAATLRIFNLAGVLVRTMQKDDATQFFQWDLRNESGFPVAAGMYIVHIDMPDVGKVKVLKLGVIPEQQFIDKW